MCTPEGFLFPLCWGPWLHKRCEVILCTSPHAVREQGRQVPWLTSVFAGLRQQTMSTPLLLTSIALVQLSTVQSLSHVRLRDPMNQSTPGLPAHHQLPEFTQTHVHWVSDAIQRSHPLSSPSPPAFNLCQHQGLFQWVSSSHKVAKILEFQLQHQSSSWIFGTYFL